MKQTIDGTIVRICAQNSLEAGREIRNAINNLSLEERWHTQQSILKRSSQSRAADAVGEAIGLRHLERLAYATGYNIQMVVGPSETYHIGKQKRPKSIYVFFDAIDGTSKVVGLGGAQYQANDGNWGIGFAFTNPTHKPLEDLMIGDFVSAAVISGNPRVQECAPQEVYAIKTPEECAAYDSSGRQVYTTTQSKLSRTFAHFESFQAFDRKTTDRDTGLLATKLYSGLIDRNSGGAFDVLRTYGNLSAFIAAMLGWRDNKLPESQGGVFIVLNENLWNMIPCTVINEAAGGISTDLCGKPLSRRALKDGRANVMHAANQELYKQAMHCVQYAQKTVKSA